MLLEQLYTEYQKKLLTIALRQLGDLDMAQDFVQRTFLSALHHGYNPAKGANPYTWLVNLLQWEIQTHYREQTERGVPPEKLLPLEEMGEELGVYSPVSMERSVDAAICIKRLPLSLRGVAEQYFLWGYTADEIATQLSVAPRTIKRMITRIYNTLREI